MKRTNPLFLITVRRNALAICCRKTLSCLLIPLGIGLIIGCGCGDDIEDLSSKTLVIHKVTLSQSTINIKESTTVIAEVYYSGEAEELSYWWMAEKGTILNNGMIFNAAESKSKRTDKLLCLKAAYFAPEKIEGAETYIDRITLEIHNTGKTVSSGINVSVENPTATTSTSNDSKTTDTQ